MKSAATDNNILSEYSAATKNLLSKSENYLDNISNNKYAGKIIRLKNRPVGYVTKEGYFKHVPNENILKSILGKNGCPSEVINVNQESKTYNTSGELLNKHV